MTANDSEPAGRESDPVMAFALWLQQLHREAGKPSYTQLVRRSRRRYPRATVREGTISEMINGKRLPRWETVEPVAWALGGDAAVEACRQRWIEADAARTPTPPAAPDRANPAPAVVDPPAEPAMAPAAAPTAPDTTGPSGAPDAQDSPRRRRWVAVGVTAAASAAAAALVYITASPGSGPGTHLGTPTSSAARSPSATATHAAGPSSPRSSSPAPPPTPGTTLLTVHSSHPTSTRDGLVTISVLSVNGSDIPGAVYSVITPWTSCRVQGGDVGQSVVIKSPSAGWIRLVITDFPASDHTDATRPDFDIPINFQITRGQGTAPHATQTCR
ncbi:hypothetical protein AB0950_39520 [Streptomyces sp. NPDC007189]|uniref:hypothetical protein n=1 Tax=Streptomyces sp. NPDC007189 TaxID=3154315 RepID=UPI003455B92D